MLKILGIDLAPQMIVRAKENNPEAEFKVMDCRNINELEYSYDAIVCSFGLPYLSDIESKKLFKDVRNLLRKNGLFYLSTMEGEYDLSGYYSSSSGVKEQLYIYYHSENFIKKELKKNGFKIKYDKSVEIIDANNDQIKDYFLLAVKSS
jgi:predicted TPR repeat methyltransferase